VVTVSVANVLAPWSIHICANDPSVRGRYLITIVYSIRYIVAYTTGHGTVCCDWANVYGNVFQVHVPSSDPAPREPL
jgi:hypothetical protein